ncbi:GNAT family N-acetyltransferase [Micromonospora sp. WMMC415]|nr:GNAT family N-acetyltransferase [Micromonospora sp. WMMC415]
MSSTFSLRAAEPEDYEFLTDMLLEAINWLPGRNFSRERILTDPEISHYIAGWRRHDDLGVIAVGQDGQPRGGAWLRYLTSDDPGYGYVSDDEPELTIGVRPEWRGQGTGRALLRELIRTSHRQGIKRISLSVERANRAMQLYIDEGFAVVEQLQDTDTMVVETR